MCQADFFVSLVAVSSAFTIRRSPPRKLFPAGSPLLLSDFAKDIVALIPLRFADAVQLTTRGPPPLLGGVVDILTFLVLQT